MADATIITFPTPRASSKVNACRNIGGPVDHKEGSDNIASFGQARVLRDIATYLRGSH